MDQDVRRGINSIIRDGAGNLSELEIEGLNQALQTEALNRNMSPLSDYAVKYLQEYIDIIENFLNTGDSDYARSVLRELNQKYTGLVTKSLLKEDIIGTSAMEDREWYSSSYAC